MAFPNNTHQQGSNTARKISVERVYDPNVGPVTVETWEGDEDALTTQAAQATKPVDGTTDTAGIRARVYQFEGPIFRMTKTIPDAGADAATDAQDRWERVTEYVQEDLRSNPKVIQAAGGSRTLQLWVSAIKAALGSKPVPLTLTEYYQLVFPDETTGTATLTPDGESFTLSDFTTTVADEEEQIYDLYARGAEAHEIKRFVVRRRRTFSPDFAAKSLCNALEKIYTTSALIRAFAIPDVFAALLPADPGFVPTGTAWAWKERQDNLVYSPATNKIEETKDWVFAAWSTLLYELVV